MQDIVISTWDWYMLWSCNTKKENWWCYTALIWTTMSDGKFHLLMWLFKARQGNEFDKGPGRQTGRKRQLLISPVWCQLVLSKAWGKLRAITAWCVRVCVCCFQSMCSHSKSLFPIARKSCTHSWWILSSTSAALCHWFCSQYFLTEFGSTAKGWREEGVGFGDLISAVWRWCDSFRIE